MTTKKSPSKYRESLNEKSSVPTTVELTNPTYGDTQCTHKGLVRAANAIKMKTMKEYRE
jgi:hypothetical protein